MLLAWRSSFAQRIIEFLLSPFDLALLLQFGAHGRFKLDQQFNVQRRIITPVSGQRPVRPVGRGMLFRKRQSQIMFGDGS